MKWRKFFSESIKVLTKTFIIVLSKLKATKNVYITLRSLCLPIPSFYLYALIKKLFPNHCSFETCCFHTPISQKFTNVCYYDKTFFTSIQIKIYQQSFHKPQILCKILLNFSIICFNSNLFIVRKIRDININSESIYLKSH